MAFPDPVRMDSHTPFPLPSHVHRSGLDEARALSEQGKFLEAHQGVCFLPLDLSLRRLRMHLV